MEKIKQKFYCQLPEGMYNSFEDKLLNIVQQFYEKLDYFRVDLDMEDYLVVQPEITGLNQKGLNEFVFTQSKPRTKEYFFIVCVEVQQKINPQGFKPKISIEFDFNKDFTTEQANEWEEWFSNIEELED